MVDDPGPGSPPSGGWVPPGPPPYGYLPPRGTNGFAIASLVCAFVCAPLGLVFGIMARNQIRQTGEDGAGLAQAGIIASAVFCVLTVVWFVVALAVVLRAR